MSVHTHPRPQALLRSIVSLRLLMLILVVLWLTFSVAFWQIMSFNFDPETSVNRIGQDFGSLRDAVVRTYV